MTRWPIVTVVGFLALSATYGRAEQPFVVRADESPQDSRILIDVGQAPFMLERIGSRQLDLVTPEMSRSFDISALSPVGRSRRIAAARVVEGEDLNRLRLTLSCDCAYGFRISDGTLSITFRAPQPETVAAAPTARRKGSRLAPQFAPRPFPKPVTASATEASTVPIELTPSSNKDGDVALARDHLLKQLSRAAEQGLLEFVSDDVAIAAPDADDTPTATPIETQTEDVLADTLPTPKKDEDAGPVEDIVAKGPLRPSAPREAPLRARTAIDKVFRTDRAETFQATAPCIDRKSLDLSGWNDENDFVAHSLRLRNALTDDFDQPSPEMVRALAHVYILYGFGVEAEKTLATFGKDLAEQALLIEIARIVEDRPLDRDGPIALSSPCHGPALLWRRIANMPRSETPPSQAVRDEMITAFEMLPARLKRMVAAPLLSALADAGELEDAARLNDVLSRTPSVDDPALDLAQARLLAAGGDAVAAEGFYARLAKRDAPEARESLIRLLDSRLARGADISVDLADALSDLAFTSRRHPLELAAKTAEIRARVATDGPIAALTAVREAMARAPHDEDVLRDAGHAALEKLAPGPGEQAMEYVQAVMAHETSVSQDRDGDPARRRVARELVDLGLANAALKYLAPALQRREPAVRLVAAEALIAIDDIEGGLAELKDLSDPQAARLRAAALARSNQFEDAAAVDPDDPEFALRAGDWSKAAEINDGPRGALAAYMANASGETKTPSGETPTISGARAAAEAAKATRALVDEALSDG